MASPSDVPCEVTRWYTVTASQVTRHTPAWMRCAAHACVCLGVSLYLVELVELEADLPWSVSLLLHLNTLTPTRTRLAPLHLRVGLPDTLQGTV